MPYGDIIKTPGVPNIDYPPPSVDSRIPGSQFPTGISVLPASGYYENAWPMSGAIPESFSTGGWTTEAIKIPQQTFLGASIRSFTMNAGFGDSSSTLGVELVVDEFNKSDLTGFGLGDDVYHNGINDQFSPPMVGSPVFFKFGPSFATVEEAFMQSFDDLYGVDTGDPPPPTSAGSYNLDTTTSLGNQQYVQLQGQTGSIMNYQPVFSGPNRGRNHIVFGGILQSYTQNRGPGGNPLYSLQVVDPREILANVTVILNNYSGSIYDQTNLMNVYGFLEYNPSRGTKESLGTPNPLTKVVSSDGSFVFTGNDTYSNASFPITGTGFSRRGPQGIPWYRVKQALNTIMGYNGPMPDEYNNKGFGGLINFRGFNYVVDFSGLPELPNMYYLDFDQINILELAMEICDITSRELYVTLLPVINHPKAALQYAWNNSNSSDPLKLIAGIIKIQSIDRSIQPSYGSIKRYIDSLPMPVENQDVGYELANITTDKFIVGAQEVEMYYFSTNADRDTLEVTSSMRGSSENTPAGYQWRLDSSLEQQVLPYYGMLGKNAVTIPKGFGSYQQILLDTTGLNANGVGAYYVTTEMELRCASISFDKWKSFLQIYNDIYLESLESDDAQEIATITQVEATDQQPISISNAYGVTVPRSLFDTYALRNYGDDGLPFSACNPPYGYPLYYKRMTKLGIPEGGLTDIQSRYTTIITNFAELRSTDGKNFKTVLDTQYRRLREIKERVGLSELEQEYFDALERILNDPSPKTITDTVALVEKSLTDHKDAFAILPKIAKKNIENAMKVYNFLKSVADECLGKKFLVKLPKKVNLKYNPVLVGTPEHTQGPFGFPPRSVSNIPGYEFSSAFRSQINSLSSDQNMMKSFLVSGIDISQEKFVGAMEINYNPISEQYESNYNPTDLGGFFEFDLLQNLIPSGFSNSFSQQPLGVRQGLIPQDLTNFINDQGRISPYVRFDHSEHLSLNTVPSDDMTQQIKFGSFMIPDLCEFLDNVNGDDFHSFPNLEEDNEENEENEQDVPEQVAFVKCSVSENLFMPPKTLMRSISVHGSEIKDIGRKSLPQKIYLPEEDRYVDSWSYYVAHYVPIPIPGGGQTVDTLDFNRYVNTALNSYIINTELDQLDTNNVYALITLPSKIIPTKDARFRDGPFQRVNAERFKHIMTMDTVDLPEFSSPGIVGGPFPKKSIDATDDQRILAWQAAKQAIQGLNFGAAQRIEITSPSPVYPDLVVLPLISRDRCYGPWVSSQLDGQANIFKNIGGRIEFIKDENLSPWNYAGYQLMNEAGRLQAEFSNSLMLFSERGGFVVPGLPPGNSLGRMLIDGGPLVTSIDISFSEGGIQTTYQMDLYTSSFGKLQKQKQDQISKISRERQRLRDERNSLIRKGFGKMVTSVNYGSMYDRLKNDPSPEGMTEYTMPYSNFVASVTRNEEERASSQGGGLSQGIYGSASFSPHTLKTFAVDASVQDRKHLASVAQNMLTEETLAREYFNTASASVSKLYLPVSKDVGHPNMASKPPAFVASRSQYYVPGDENNALDLSDVTHYGA